MQKRFILVISHRRSGTHWTLDAIRHNISGVELSFFTLDALLPTDVIPDNQSQVLPQDLTRYISECRNMPIFKSHMPVNGGAWRDHPVLFDLAKDIVRQSFVIYVVRDGRDVLVSLYRYCQSDKVDITAGTFKEFLRAENEFSVAEAGRNRMARPQYWASHVCGWDKRDVDEVVRYRDLHTDYRRTVTRIAGSLGFRVSRPVARIEAGHDSLLNRVLARVIPWRGESSAVLAGGGRSGYWKEWYDESDLSFFMESMEEARCQLLDEVLTDFGGKGG